MRISVNVDSEYAPLRYEATRPYAVQLGKMYLANQKKGESARANFLRNELFPLIKTAVEKLSSPEGPGPVQAELTNIQVFGCFHGGGRVIFDVARVLSQTLLVTDIEDIPCSELVFPVESFYLHFGPFAGLNDGVYEIEGAFVTHSNDRLMIDLVPVTFGDPAFFELPMGDLLIGVSIDLSSGPKSIAAALHDSITNTLESNRAYFAKIAEVEAQLSAQYGEVVRVPVTAERLGDREPLLARALKLIVNTLFFLVAAPDDTQEDWGQGTPLDMIERLNSAVKVGTRKTIENTLTKDGYVKVRYVGRRYADTQEARDIGVAVEAGRVMPTHIRRGHFRRQAYGPERALRKTIFVAPTIVNAGKSDDMPGKIYEV